MKGTKAVRGKHTKLTTIHLNGKVYQLPAHAVRKFRAAMGQPKSKPERTLTRNIWSAHAYTNED